MNPYKLYVRLLHSKYKWVVVLITLIYLLSPLDIIPEILIPFVGLIDDGILLAILVRELTLGSKREKNTEKRDPIDVESNPKSE